MAWTRWMVAALVLSATAGWSTTSKVLDRGEFASAEAARAAWVPDEATPAVTLAPVDGRQLVQLNADFTTPKPRRMVYDRVLNEDLSRWDRIGFELYVEDPGLFGSWTVYFRSPGGWYGAPVAVPRKGWNQISLTRAAFRTEDTPEGWHKITGIRLAGWRGADRQGFARLRNLTVYREAWVIVLNTRAPASEARAAQEISGNLGEMLAEAGIPAGSITDLDADAGALEGRELAILPHDPGLAPSTVKALQAFVAGGGKLMVFYGLPAELATTLGLKTVGWSKEAYPGQLSQIRFEAQAVEGLPATLDQHSWNLNRVEAVPGKAKVIGWWYDAAGKPTGFPAFTTSDAGVYMSHVLMSTDSARTRLLLALVGQYSPEVWPLVADKAIAGPERLGLADGLDAARAWITRAAAEAPRGAEAKAKLVEADTARQEAARQRDAKQYAKAVETAERANDLTRQAYLLAQKPRHDEFRACWNHSGTGAFGTWAESMKNLHDSGFNAIVPNMLWGGYALYDSAVLPHAAVVAEKGDQIAACVAAAKPYGIQVHVWKVNWNLGGQVSKAFRDQLLADQRLQVGFDGKTVEWLCPSDPRNVDLEANSMIEVASKYDVDGVHFDYIRYPDDRSCFCPRCRQQFEATLGAPVANWPADVRKPELRAKWTQFRCDNISRLVQRVAEGVRKVKPHVKISAAVFSNYPNCRDDVGQDWVHWIQQGWLDFVCPMDYNGSDEGFAAIVGKQMSYIQGKVPIYPGIGVSSSASTLPPDRAAGQVQLTRDLGADGFTIFNYGPSEARDILPRLRLAALDEPGVMPHDAPAFTFDLGELALDRVAGRHATSGSTVTVTVKRGTDVPGRGFGAVTGDVVLETLEGNVLRKLAAAPVERCQVQVSGPNGAYRVAVRGTVQVAGKARPFVARSMPIIFGPAR